MCGSIILQNKILNLDLETAHHQVLKSLSNWYQYSVLQLLFFDDFIGTIKDVLRGEGFET